MTKKTEATHEDEQRSLLSGTAMTADESTTTKPVKKVAKIAAAAAGVVAAAAVANAALSAKEKKEKKPAAVVASQATPEVLSIALSAIVADKKFNSRDSTIEDPDGAKLVESIRADGLLEPLVVKIHKTDKDGEPTKFYLISGFRRFGALSRLAEEDSEKYARALCRIIDVTDEVDQKIKNLVENIVRSDLAPHELASTVFEISQSGITNAQLAKRLGVSRSHIANLVRCKANLHPTLWAGLRNVREGARDGAGVTLTWFIQMAALNHDDQIARWEEKLGKNDEPSPDDSDGEEPKKERSKAPSKRVVEEYMFALKTVPKAERDDEWKHIYDTLKWVRGERRTPPLKLDVVADGDE